VSIFRRDVSGGHGVRVCSYDFKLLRDLKSLLIICIITEFIHHLDYLMSSHNDGRVVVGKLFVIVPGGTSSIATEIFGQHNTLT